MTGLTFARVVDGPAAALELILDRELSGYAVFTPQDTLLLDGDGAGVLSFDAGVPTHAKHTGTGRGGAAALADAAVPGPLRVECYASEDGPVPRTDEYAVAPGTPAKRLAGDAALADRTRAAAPDDRTTDSEGAGGSLDAVEAFLEDEEKIEAIRERARDEAEERAEEWGLDDELA